MLSWDDFRYVKAIADTVRWRARPAALGVNHSTVFRRLGQIEQQLGSRLFERGRAGYALTACGEEMVELAERMGDDIVSFERKVTGQDLRPSGELRVTTSDMVLLHLLNDVLVGFRRAYPEIVLDVVVSNQRLNLSKRDADVAVRATYQQPGAAGGAQGRAHRLGGVRRRRARGRSRSIPRDGRHHDWIAFADHDLDRAGRRSGSRSTRTRSASSTRSTPCSAWRKRPPAASGWRCCRASSARRCRARAAQPAVAELEGELWLLTHPDLRNTARVRAFLDFCTDEIAQRRKVIECRLIEAAKGQGRPQTITQRTMRACAGAIYVAEQAKLSRRRASAVRRAAPAETTAGARSCRRRSCGG